MSQEEMPSSREVWERFSIFFIISSHRMFVHGGEDGQNQIKKMEKLRKCLFSSNKSYSHRRKIWLLEKSQTIKVRRARNVHSTSFFFNCWPNRTYLKESTGLLPFAWLPQNRKRAWLNGWAAAQWSSDFCTCKNSSVASAQTDRQAC